MIITVTEQGGRCRWCQCTDAHACEGGCSWANRAHTVCSRCATFDQVIRSRRGRRVLSDIFARWCKQTGQ